MNNTTIQKVEGYVKSIMRNHVAHDFKHVDRVRNWAVQIAQKEGYKDREAVEIAALMHDIGITQTKQWSMHGEIGAKMAARFLDRLLEQKRIAEICNAIKYHNKNRVGEGKLLAIVRDADMMELFGAVGTMRAFTSQASRQEFAKTDVKGETWQMKAVDFDKRFDNGIGIGNYIIDHINFQISCYDNLNTKTAKIMAKPLIDFMKAYVKQLDKEICEGRKGI